MEAPFPIRFEGGAGPGGNGLLTTAGRLLFGRTDGGGNFVAFDPANGKPLWHTHLGNVSNAAETYMLDEHEYVLVAAGDELYTFALFWTWRSMRLCQHDP